MEEFYYAAIHHAIRDTLLTENLATTLRGLKAKIIRLSSKNMRGVLMDTADTDAIPDEDITTYHHIRSRRRAKSRTVSQVLDNNGQLQTDHEEIMKIFTTYLESKYSNIQRDTNSFLKMPSCGMPQINIDANTEFDSPFTIDELRKAVDKGKRNKSSGPDGICHELYQHMRECCKHDLLDIINQMYLEGLVCNEQKQGYIVCLPKISAPTCPENYRPLSILNSDYKLLTRIIANRLRPCLEDILHPNQYCGRDGKSIYDAVATVRDIAVYAEHTNTPLCLLSIDFSDAFGRVSHTYLLKILQE